MTGARKERLVTSGTFTPAGGRSYSDFPTIIGAETPHLQERIDRGF
ncbi:MULTISPECIES: hypothetical protein [unclassified Streptomyces]